MNYDKIIIGSSPICLLEAIHSDSNGIKTCIIDNSEELGGAWKKLNTESGTIKNVEIGCHIMEKDKKVYDFFIQNLCLELSAMQPQPKIILRNKFIAYNLKNFLVLYRNGRSYFGYKHGLKQFIFDLGVVFKEMREYFLKYYTFSNDSITFIDRLINEFKQRKIPVLTSTDIVSASISTTDKSIELTTGKGDILKTGKLVITYNTYFNRLLINGKDRTNIFQHKHYEFVHMHLHINDPRVKKISYWRIFNNEMIHRVSDMSGQIARREGEHLICVGIYSTSMKNKSNAEITERILFELRKMKLISDSCRVLKAEISSYKGQYTDLYDLKRLEVETNNTIEVLNTLDITRGIKENLYKYKTVNYLSNK